MKEQVWQLTEVDITGWGRDGGSSSELWAGYRTEPGGKVDSHLQIHITEEGIGGLGTIAIRRQQAIELRDLLTKFIKQTTQ